MWGISLCIFVHLFKGTSTCHILRYYLVLNVYVFTFYFFLSTFNIQGERTFIIVLVCFICKGIEIEVLCTDLEKVHSQVTIRNKVLVRCYLGTVPKLCNCY